MQFNQSGAQLNAEVHPAQYMVLYVGLRGTTPVLKLADGVNAPQELADDVEDDEGAVRRRHRRRRRGRQYVGADNSGPEANLVVTNKTQRDLAWRKVLSMRVALLMRSEDRASAVPHKGDVAGDNVYYLFDSRVKRPSGIALPRRVYDDVALRNRLSNY